MNFLKDLIPPKWRQAIYYVLGAAVGVNHVLHLVSGGVEEKVVGVAAVFGFVLAGANTNTSV